MEDALREEGDEDVMFSVKIVLILVLMEDALRVIAKNQNQLLKNRS